VRDAFHAFLVPPPPKSAASNAVATPDV